MISVTFCIVMLSAIMLSIFYARCSIFIVMLSVLHGLFLVLLLVMLSFMYVTFYIVILSVFMLSIVCAMLFYCYAQDRIC
jgi:hypothetical protein